MRGLKRLSLIILIVVAAVSTSLAQDIRDIMGNDFNNITYWREKAQCFMEDEGYIVDTSTVYGTNVISRDVDGYVPEAGNTEWEVSVKCDFDNSSVNNFQIYLIANGDDPYSADFRGWAIGTGFKPSYKTVSLLYYHDGIADVMATTDVAITKNKYVSLKIGRTASGTWSINGIEVYKDAEPESWYANNVAVSFTFNKTGAGNFCFRFLSFEQDYEAVEVMPSVENAKILNPSTVRINLKGSILATSAVDVDNYLLCGISPDEVLFKYYYVDLIFNDGILSAEKMKLETKPLTDNQGRTTTYNVQIFNQAQRGSIVVNEIMADINPVPLALPAKKYVELYNTSTVDFSLDGYTFWIEDVSYTLPDLVIKSGDYMILASDAETFASYGQCVSVFQESKITVGGKHLELRNLLDEVVDAVDYSVDFYNDDNRNSGGYSMERLDPYNNCRGIDNWKASVALSGGTPGYINSVYHIYEDTEAPTLVSSEMMSSSRVRLDFSEEIFSANFVYNGKDCSVKTEGASVYVDLPSSMAQGNNVIIGNASDVCGSVANDITVDFVYIPLTVKDVRAVSTYQVLVSFSTPITDFASSYFSIDDGTCPFLSEIVSDADNCVLLSFPDDFEVGTKHTLMIDGVCNSIGDTIHNCVSKYKYHAIQSGDIVVNEIMYYPAVGCKRFVELYNTTDDDILLYGLVLSGYTADGALLRSCMIDCLSFLPSGGYAVVSADTSSVLEQYLATGLQVQQSRFPTLNTSRGYVALASLDGVTIDSVYYDNAMHSQLMEQTRGVSLERISASGASLDASNWTSSTWQRLATAGFVNSCTHTPDDNSDDNVISELDSNEESSEEITVENQLMHPGDADMEYTLIFNFRRQSEPSVSIDVYSAEGCPVRCLASSLPTYKGCSVSWDGFDDSGNRCVTGIYVVIVKAIDETGWSRRYKFACVVGARR